MSRRRFWPPDICLGVRFHRPGQVELLEELVAALGRLLPG